MCFCLFARALLLSALSGNASPLRVHWLFWAHLMVLGFHLRLCFSSSRHSAVLCLLGLWLQFFVWKVEGEGVVSDLSSRYGAHCPNVGHVLLKVWCVSMAPLHAGAPFGCQGLLCLARLCGACLWGWDLVVSGVRPPMCGCPSVWLVCLRC